MRRRARRTKGVMGRWIAICCSAQRKEREGKRERGREGGAPERYLPVDCGGGGEAEPERARRESDRK